MIALNLTAKGTDHIRIKNYLEQNVSEILAEKINKGVKIQKDSKTLQNKKDLDGFIKFACEEAKKQAAKGARCAMIADDVVFGWAIHYFEESSILGKLFNEDGSEYKPAPKPTTTYTKPIPKPTPPKPQNQQQSLFDLLTPQTASTEAKDDEVEKTYKTEKTKIEKDEFEDYEETMESEQKVEEIKQKHEEIEEKPQKITFYKDKLVDEDGVILTDDEIKNSFDKHTMYILSSILDGKLEIQ